MTASPKTPVRILIVDDDPVSLRLLGYTLKRHGYDVTSVNDGAEAWDMMTREVVDLVITDRAMPRIDGLDLLRRMHQSPPHRHIPVIMLTGSPLDTAEPEAEAEGAAAFLTKPVSSRELVTTIERVMGGVAS